MKSKIYLILIVCGILTVNNCKSQDSQTWEARYTGPGNSYDIAALLTVDSSGNVYVTGKSIGSGTGYDYATVKYNSSGIQQWEARYNGPGNGEDDAYSIAVDISGNVYVTGYSLGSGTGYDYATVKYNSSGVQQWVQRYNGPGNGADQAYSLAVDGSGNVYVTGYSYGVATDYDYATIKYNTSGVQQWVTRYNGPDGGFDQASSLVIDGSGNVYITGCSYSSTSNYDITTLKYNSSGVQQWVEIYNGPANGPDFARSMTIDGSGNIYVIGYSTGTGTGLDYATLKINSLGVQQWVTRYNGPASTDDYGYSVAVDGAGNVYVTGNTATVSNGIDYCTIKYNPSGIEQWVQRYNGPGNSIDRAYTIALDASANVYITGQSFGGGTGFDYATLKYNSSGVQQWAERYSGPGNANDGGYSLALDGSGNVYVTGSSVGNGTSDDYVTIKYSQLVGIQPILNQIPDAFKLEQNYPNPFNPSTNIKFSIHKAGLVTLKVYDITGREVASLVNENLNAGTYNYNFDASHLSSGAYFYKINADGFTDVKKMMLVK